MSSIESKASPLSVMSSNSAWEYLVDAAQRSVLSWDVMRQRGEQYREHMAQTVPNVLHYEVELVMDGRTLPRPVNYGLTRVVPPKGVKVDLTRRPFVIIDPRAGHGPGIGGFKADSKIGVALKAFRTLDDIRALGGNNAADERRFAAAAKLSDVNLALYRIVRSALRSRRCDARGGRVDETDASAALRRGGHGLRPWL